VQKGSSQKEFRPLLRRMRSPLRSSTTHSEGTVVRAEDTPAYQQLRIKRCETARRIRSFGHCFRRCASVRNIQPDSLSRLSAPMPSTIPQALYDVPRLHPPPRDGLFWLALGPEQRKQKKRHKLVAEGVSTTASMLTPLVDLQPKRQDSPQEQDAAAARYWIAPLCPRTASVARASRTQSRWLRPYRLERNRRLEAACSLPTSETGVRPAFPCR
jgi:hypothetical protein